MGYIQYDNHGNRVWTRLNLKGKKEELCLCSSCNNFLPGRGEYNCSKAERLSKLCIDVKLVTAVFECPEFDKVKEKPMPKPNNKAGEGKMTTKLYDKLFQIIVDFEGDDSPKRTYDEYILRFLQWAKQYALENVILDEEKVKGHIRSIRIEHDYDPCPFFVYQAGRISKGRLLDIITKALVDDNPLKLKPTDGGEGK